MFSAGNSSFSISEILNKISENNLAAIYLGAKKIPCVVRNPLRNDNHPSLGLYVTPAGRVRYRDFATGERGSILDLLCQMHATDMQGLSKILLTGFTNTSKISTAYSEVKEKDNPRTSTLQCKIRRWHKRDVEYWSSYGVPLCWLKWAEVYPISNTIFTTGDNNYVFGVDPLAYAFVEHKEGNTTIKVYQPLNKSGRKWMGKHDRSVISLWTKVPPKGERICICSSLKDSLCLSANTYIPAICVQGEGYSISATAQKELRRRFKDIYILFDNDEAGIKNGERLSKETGFTNIVLPQIEGAKDVSDLYKLWNDKEKFKTFMLNLFKI